MDLSNSLSKLSVLNFHTKYWMPITGKQRPEFDVQMFKQNNPSVTEKVDKIRAKCGVCLC